MSVKNKHKWRRVAYTAGVAGLLLSVVILMMMYVFKYSENEAFEMLHRDTYKIKNDINLQMLSDRENLQTMAGLASKLYTDGESYDLLFRSFDEIGLIRDIGILTKENKIVTRLGTVDNVSGMSFEEEKEKGAYISGRVKDATYSDIEIVRSVVPVISDGETVAILYGIIDLDALEERYSEDVTELDAKLYIIEGESGRFIVDTKNTKLGNITELAANKYKKNFSYDKMLEDITNGVSGYSSFFSRKTEEYVYVHYSDLDIADWRIMLSRPEDLVFAGARRMGNILLILFTAVVVIMVLYLLATVSANEKKARVNINASEIRKRLLTYNSHNDGIYEALEIITGFGKARSAFFVDTYGEEYHFIRQELSGKLIEGKDRAYLILTLFNIVTRRKRKQSADVQMIKIKADKTLEREMPEFYRFLVRNDIQAIHFASVVDDRNNISLIAAVDPNNPYIDTLFNDIAVCFAIAIYNKKHLVKTEEMALTDSLTNLENRMAYNENIKTLKNKINKLFGCVYIDVNELHYFNNQFGHAAGDQMLAYIAEVLKEEFEGNHIYRMGGDEFLIFTTGVENAALDKRMKSVRQKVEEMKYHISYGISFGGDGKTNIEDIVLEAEKNMYVDKSEYYQNKEYHMHGETTEIVKTVETGNEDVDALLSIISERYLGVYSVSLDNDVGTQIIAPEYYFAMKNEENRFSDVMKQYIHDIAKPEFHRVLMSFISYDAVKEQLKKGQIPHITYKKADGGSVNLSVYPNSKAGGNGSDTIWVFEGMDDVEN